MRIYFDACCVNRLTDEQEQERILRESEAIEALIDLATSEPNVWVGSVVLEAEISRNPDSDRREDAMALLSFVKQVVELNEELVSRARQLQSIGFSEFDALHLACAEAGQADIFLSTDDSLVRRANRQPGKLGLRVLNPVSFLEEIGDAYP